MLARAVVFVAPRRVEIRPLEIGPIGEGEVLVRTLYSGVSSGTEMLAYRGAIDPDLPLDERIGALGGTFEYPFSYGYSCVGEVEHSSGSLEVGTTVFAFHPHQDVFKQHASEVIPLSETKPRIATMFPSVETALQVQLDAGEMGGQPVVVFGLGTVGLLAAALLARAGAEVLGVDPKPWRRAAAAAFGVEASAPDDVSDELARRTSGEGAALVVEASGDPGVLAGTLALLRHEGTALVASWYGTRPAALPLGQDFHRRRLTIRSTQVSTIPARLAGEWTFERRRRVALDLMDELPLGHLASHEFAFEDVGAAFEILDRGEEGVMHVALRYGRGG